jgi:SAM-dependent methyltransferase
MQLNNLPQVGVISNTSKDTYGRDGKLSGKNVLCVGFSETEVDNLVEKYSPKKITLLTNWVDHCDARIDKYKLCIGDITKKTEFENESFDVILTLSVMEHLSNIETANAEMLRILKSNGAAIHMFGPTWSSAYGHHLYIDHLDPLLNFSLWQTPAHMHLLCSKKEIYEFYKMKGYDNATSELVVYQIFESDIINRFTIDDYNKIFFSKEWHVDSYERMYNVFPLTHQNKLKVSHPDYTDFNTYGLKIHLTKSI